MDILDYCLLSSVNMYFKGLDTWRVYCIEVANLYDLGLISNVINMRFKSWFKVFPKQLKIHLSSTQDWTDKKIVKTVEEHNCYTRIISIENSIPMGFGTIYKNRTSTSHLFNATNILTSELIVSQDFINFISSYKCSDHKLYPITYLKKGIEFQNELFIMQFYNTHIQDIDFSRSLFSGFYRYNFSEKINTESYFKKIGLPFNVREYGHDFFMKFHSFESLLAYYSEEHSFSVQAIELKYIKFDINEFDLFLPGFGVSNLLFSDWLIYALQKNKMINYGVDFLGRKSLKLY